VLYRRIVRLGWHPFLRINRGGTFHPAGQAQRRRLMELVPRVGDSWAGRGVAFQGPESHLACTLLARWDPGHTDPWLVLTDPDPQDCSVAWYGVRTWIEEGSADTPEPEASCLFYDYVTVGASGDIRLVAERSSLATHEGPQRHPKSYQSISENRP